MPPAPEPRGLLLDIGGVVHATGIHLVGRLAEAEPALRPVLERIGGIATDRDALWQQMLRSEMVDLMTDTRAAGLRLGALTNDMTDFHGAEWVARQEHLKLFDVIIDAGLLGILKPDPRAFGRAAGELGLAAAQIVFLDGHAGERGGRATGWADRRPGAVGRPGAGHRHRQGAARAAGPGLVTTIFREQACR